MNPTTSNSVLRILVFGAALLGTACIVEKSETKKPNTTAVSQATPAYAPDSIISVPFDSVTPDTAGLGAQIGNLPPLDKDTGFTRINEKSAAATLTKFPTRIPTRGAAALQIEILLDRAGFSPGIIDGTWGPNAAKALTWFRVANGLDSATAASSMSDTSAVSDQTKTKSAQSKKTTAKTASSSARTATIDQSTYQKLAAAGQSTPLLTSYQVTAEDVKGPFVQIPNNVYQQAKLDCTQRKSARW